MVPGPLEGSLQEVKQSPEMVARTCISEEGEEIPNFQEETEETTCLAPNDETPERWRIFPFAQKKWKKPLIYLRQLTT